jgi:hypothetical protein
MPLSIFSDGTQVFGIPDSPVTINSITYIAEDINITRPSNRPEIKDASGLPIGQVIIPQIETGTAKLQLASGSTAIPTIGLTMILATAKTYYLTEVGRAYTQGNYAYVNISFAEKLN